jgi:cysteine desulfurase
MTDSSVYLDYQASAPIDPAVLAAMTDAYATPGNASAEDHSFGWRARERVETARRQVAGLVNSNPEEVYFTSGASEANNIAILGAARAAPAARRRILVSAIEHRSVLEPAKMLELEGFTLEAIPVGRNGLIDLPRLKDRLSDDVALVSVMAVNNEIGTIQPSEVIAALGNVAGAFVHIDATQALAAEAVDFRAWCAASIAVTAHKIYGPTGVGALILADDSPWRPRPISFGGGQESGLRPGTIATPLCVGMGVACALLAEHGEEERGRVSALRSRLIDALRAQGVEFAITAEGSPRHPGSLHVRLAGVDAADLLARLQPHIAASTGSACTSGVIGPSEVLRAISMDAEEAAQCIRLSLGRFTTAAELDRAAERIAQALEAQRGAYRPLP